MKITAALLGRMAKNLLGVLNAQGARSFGDASKLVGKTFDVPEAGERVAFASRGDDVVINYESGSHGQTPIMVIVRPQQAKVMLTFEKGLDGYKVFDDTPLGQMQDRKFASLEAVHEELTNLEALASGPSAAIDALLETARACLGRRDAKGAHAPAQEALAAARQAADKGREAASLVALGTAERMLGRPADGRAHLEQALASYESLSDTEGQGSALMPLLGTCRELKDYAAARKHGKRLQQMVKGQGPGAEGMILFNVAYIDALDGRSQKAIPALKKARDLMREAGNQAGVAQAEDAIRQFGGDPRS